MLANMCLESHLRDLLRALGNQWMPPIIGDGTDLFNRVGPGFCEATTVGPRASR